MAESPSTDAVRSSRLPRVFRESPLSGLSWAILTCLLLAGGAWVFMNQLVVFGNSIHDRMTAEQDPELPEGLTHEEQLMYTISDIGRVAGAGPKGSPGWLAGRSCH